MEQIQNTATVEANNRFINELQEQYEADAQIGEGEEAQAFQDEARLAEAEMPLVGGDDDDDEARSHDNPNGTKKALEKIRDMMAILLSQRDQGQRPHLEATVDDRLIQLQWTTLFQKRRFASVMLVIDFCSGRMSRGVTAEIRDFYYEFVTFWKNYSECIRAIKYACAILDTDRYYLNLRASTKGLIAGPIQFVDRESNSVKDGTDGDGLYITTEFLKPDEERRFDIVTEAVCLCIMESNAAFQIVKNAKVWEHPDLRGCLFLTARGFPDHSSQTFVRELCIDHNMRLVGVVDCNPSAIWILNTYAVGGTRRDRDDNYNALMQIDWLTLWPRQLNEFFFAIENPLPDSVRQNLSPRDTALLKNLRDVGCPFIGDNENRQNAVAEMEFKVEVEALQLMPMEESQHGFLVAWITEGLLRYLGHVQPGEQELGVQNAI